MPSLQAVGKQTNETREAKDRPPFGSSSAGAASKAPVWQHGRQPAGPSPASAPTRLAVPGNAPYTFDGTSPNSMKVLARPMSNSFDNPLQRALEILDMHNDQAGVEYEDYCPVPSKAGPLATVDEDEGDSDLLVTPERPQGSLSAARKR